MTTLRILVQTQAGEQNTRTLRVVRRMKGISLQDGPDSDCFGVDIQTALALLLARDRSTLVRILDATETP